MSFARFLNEMGHTRAKNGAVLVKKTEQAASCASPLGRGAT